MRGASLTLAAASALLSVSDAATTEEWMSRSIYQVMIDRFAKTDGSTTATCETLSEFCNGTWAGLINQLDYIQGEKKSADLLLALTARLSHLSSRRNHGG